MPSSASLPCSTLFIIACIVVAGGPANTGQAASSTSIRLKNSCPYTVWACLDSGCGGLPVAAIDDSAVLFQLAAGQSVGVPVPSVWCGRISGRTDSGASYHDNSAAAAATVTTAELSLNATSGAMDFYSISLVHGYNLPMLIEPPLAGEAASGGRCTPTACVFDVDSECPAELRVPPSVPGAAAACQSACQAFGTPQFCCSGAYAYSCKPSPFSEILKRSCPNAISFASDNSESVFACTSAENITLYTVSFCPPASMSSAPGKDGGTTEEGSKESHINHVVAILGLVTAVLSFVTAVLVLLKKFCLK